MLPAPLGRGLGTLHPEQPLQYNTEQELTLHILTIVFSSFSVVSGIWSLYWFLIMRRLFRHDLIMFLIQSDMFKAIWMLVYGIASLMPGSIASGSTFCQASGFLTSLAIEASDFAVLMISLHNALYIFNPPATVGEGGLYRFRHTALGVWIAFPFLMASVAFTNPKGGYYVEAIGCTLPVRPFWYRLALSWIPRYVIFVTILGLDVAIYAYIRYVFRDVWKYQGTPREPIRNRRRARYTGGSDRSQWVYNRYSVPTTPRLVYHGLLPDTRQASIAVRERQWEFVPDAESPSLRSQSEGGSWTPKWASLSLRRPATMPALPTSELEHTLADIMSVSDPNPSLPSLLTPDTFTSPDAPRSWTTFIPHFYSRPESMVSVLSFLRTRPHHSGFTSTPASPAIQLEIPEFSRLEVRDRTRYQLRFLFVYPLAYMGMWIVPFVSHILQYNDRYAARTPFILTALSNVFLASQCAVDCWIFSIREKPWRSPLEKSTALKKAINFLTACRRGSCWTPKGPGKSRVQMAAEARVAYARRDEERATRASEMSITGRTVRGERSWWDDSEDELERIGILLERNACLLDGSTDSPL